MNKCGAEHPEMPGVLCRAKAGEFHSEHFARSDPLDMTSEVHWPNAANPRPAKVGRRTLAEKAADIPPEDPRPQRPSMRPIPTTPIQSPLPDPSPDFDGSDYDRRFDHPRLSGQLLRIFTLMSDRSWRTTTEIAEITNDPAPSVLAQLGHLRKSRFGAYEVEKRIRGRREDGLYEYRLDPTPGSGVPRANPLLMRAQEAEAWSLRLANALEAVAPHSPVLLEFRGRVGERLSGNEDHGRNAARDLHQGAS